MSAADSITDEQKALIQSWADEGNDLSSIQKKLVDELEINVTYMEVRFLLADLDIKMPVKEKPVEEQEEEAAAGEDESGEDFEPGEEAGTEGMESSIMDEEGLDSSGASSVTVTMSDVLPPGMLAGGTVIFSDGVQATWGLNQLGQLSLDGADPGYRPSDADLESFQRELQRLAQEKGM